METRKVVYIAALIVMELASQEMQPPKANGTAEMMRNQDYSISIEQDKYEDLLKYKWMYEENVVPELTVDMEEVNNTVEALYSENDRLLAQLQEATAHAESLQQALDMPRKDGIHLFIGGNVLTDMQGGMGFGVELSATIKKVEPYVGLDWIDDRVWLRGGAKYRIK